VSWSPDGRHIAFSHFIVGERDRFGQDAYEGGIYLYSLDNDSVRRLTGSAGTHARDDHPAWSPDGKLLAFVRYSREEAHQIVVLDAARSEERVIFNGQVAQGFGSSLSWSPDGDHLAFVLFKPDCEDISVLNLRTSDIVVFVEPTSCDRSPSWSPDGKWIVYTSTSQETPTRTRISLVLIRPDGSGKRVLDSDVQYPGFPAWIRK
jgi:TolB protein